MPLTISDSLHRLIEVKMRNGKFQSVEELLVTGLLSIDDSNEPYFGDFTPQEFELLIDEAEKSGPFIPADEVEARLDQRRALWVKAHS